MMSKLTSVPLASSGTSAIVSRADDRDAPRRVGALPDTTRSRHHLTRELGNSAAVLGRCFLTARLRISARAQIEDETVKPFSRAPHSHWVTVGPFLIVI